MFERHCRDRDFYFEGEGITDTFLFIRFSLLPFSFSYLKIIVFYTNAMKTVFVTVGTTSFDDLIVTLTSNECVKVMTSFIMNLQNVVLVKLSCKVITCRLNDTQVKQCTLNIRK